MAQNNAALDRQAPQVEERPGAAEPVSSAGASVDEILGRLAHELRNPLSAILNSLALLERARSEPHQAWAREALHRNAEALGRIVDAVGDISRLHRGRLAAELTDTPLAPLVDGALEQLRPLVRDREQTIQVTLPGEVPQLRADAARVREILVQLLDNALRYSPPGSTVRLEIAAAGRELRFRVQDEGAGFAPGAAARIFDAFSSGDRDTARLGIGLALVRAYAGLHGGQVDARSAGPGLGSTFEVRLPVLPEPAPTPHNSWMETE
jgi:signal transduction histidine kinase